MSRRLMALLFAVLLAAACTTGSPAAMLAGRTFVSTGVTVAGQPFDLVAGTRIMLSFGADGRMGASAGCNSMAGTFRLDGITLVVSDLGSTEMGCDPERHAQDEWLAKLLGSRPTISLSGNDLTLTAGTTVVKLLDREVAQPDLMLVGPLWTVSSIISGETVSSVPAGPVATLRFAADGTLAVFTGCNSGGASYELEGDILVLRDLVLTEIGCDGPAGELERDVLGVLGADRLRVRIDADVLEIRAGDDGLLLAGS